MTDSNRPDKLYADPLANVAEFRFDDSVADVFGDMIQRSVPGYSTILSMIGDMAERYAQANSRCYDLGCSLGAASLMMSAHIKAAGCEIVAVDNSEAMICRCRNRNQGRELPTPIQWLLEDVAHTKIENASLVVLNYTLQFIPPVARQTLIDRIYQGMNKGGVLLISEKIHFEDQQLNKLMIDLYHNFKRANGYSDLEIAQKRTALENVLISDDLNTHQSRLKMAGFQRYEPWFQCLNFASFIAIK